MPTSKFFGSARKIQPLESTNLNLIILVDKRRTLCLIIIPPLELIVLRAQLAGEKLQAESVSRKYRYRYAAGTQFWAFFF